MVHAELNSEVVNEARLICKEIDADVYLYNGTIARRRDLDCINEIFNSQQRKKAVIIPVTNGGDPDAAYKITRYLQDRYEYITALISGLCKSAGTLMVVGANEIAFSPFGELGPLDIQLSKVDRFDQLESGLSIQDALDTLEGRATISFFKIVQDYIEANNGLMSFNTAAKAASDFITHLYAPVFSRIDPEEVGARSRSMRIAIEYGQRLAVKSQNTKPHTLKALAETYSSHSFVIDQTEASLLFHRVRSANEAERELVNVLGLHARFELPRGSGMVFHALSDAPMSEGATDGKDHRAGGPEAAGSDSPSADGAPNTPAKRSRSRKSESLQEDEPIEREPTQHHRPISERLSE